MALTCARCGTQNPDGNSFCQACGSPLAAVAPRPVGPPPFGPPSVGPPPFGPPPVGPPPVGPPPVGPPPGAPGVIMGPPPNLPPPTYQSPYYAPAAGAYQAPVHRTPWVLIISAVLGLVVIMAGCGTAYAFLNARNNQASSDVLPSPSPAGTPSPIQTASPPAGSSTASTSAETVTLPPGWAATNSDPTITVTNPTGDGSVVISSGADNPTQTAQQIKDDLDKQLTAKFPDTRTCPGSTTTNGSVGGVSGIWWQMCFTATAGGQSFPGEFSLWAGANSSGSIGYGVILFTLQSRMSAFMNDAKPVLASIQWKLK
ncbi:MAG TPA: zinc ribbon domain-containing protein [Candidatus Dormibacteraeota bacterium]